MPKDENRDHLVILKDAYPSHTILHISDPIFSNGTGLYLIEGASGGYEILELTNNIGGGNFTATRALFGSLALKHGAGSLLQPVTNQEEENSGTPQD